MTMERMVEYLENRGFKAEKRYITSKRIYVFRVFKNGVTVDSEFKYPEHCDGEERDCLQIAFLENLIRNHSRALQSRALNPEFVEYCRRDVEATAALYNRMNPTIENVIFNPPATIVFWSDGTKTVVKDQGEVFGYDPEKGLAIAISKKMLGNNYSYYNVFAKWLKRYEKATVDKFVRSIPTPETAVSSLVDKWKQAMIDFSKSLEGKKHG